MINLERQDEGEEMEDEIEIGERRRNSTSCVGTTIGELIIRRKHNLLNFCICMRPNRSAYIKRRVSILIIVLDDPNNNINCHAV